MGSISPSVSAAGCSTLATTSANFRKIVNLLWADGLITDRGQKRIHALIDLCETNDYLHLNAESWQAANRRLDFVEAAGPQYSNIINSYNK